MNSNVNVEVEANKLEEFLKHALKYLRKADENIANDLADFALDEIESNYNKAEYGQAGEYMDFVKTGTQKEITVSMVGPQAWYSEFGTGTYGELSPHPLKGRFGLNPYNSGPTIRPASEKVSMKTDIPVGSLYWTYKDSNGQIHYSQGIPAQKEVYDAGQKLESKAAELADKHIRRIFE